MNEKPVVYLIPCPLNDTEHAISVLSAEVLTGIKNCTHFFVEKERTARRFFKQVWPQMIIDEYDWTAIHKAEASVTQKFVQALKQNKQIGIVSEAGCPGIADPGQILVNHAQQYGATVVPLTGPSSLLLALMASGLNGQQFCFHGYLPVNNPERKQKIKSIEQIALSTGGSHLFIETPYRNDALFKELLDTLHAETLLCIAKDIHGVQQRIRTQQVKQWKLQIPRLHKLPVVFIIGRNT